MKRIGPCWRTRAAATLAAALISATPAGLAVPVPAVAAPASAPQASPAARGNRIARLRHANQAAARTASPGSGCNPQLFGGVAPFCTDLVNHAGAVMHSVTTHAIFWDPPSSMTPAYRAALTQYLIDVGNTSAYDVLTQYTDTFGVAIHNQSTFGGSWIDKTAFPPGRDGSTASAALLDSDLQNEITAAIAANPGWGPPDLSRLYLVFLPPGVLLNGFGTIFPTNACAYHSSFGPVLQKTIYAAMPYLGTNAAGCDVPTGPYPSGDQNTDSEISTASHEQFEAASDPLGNAWFDGTVSGNEIGDLCAYVYGSRAVDGSNVTLHGHSYVLQQEWSNADDSVPPNYLKACVSRFPDHLALTAPSPVVAGTPFSVTVTATDANGHTALTTGYVGQVHFLSSDGSATLPADYQFVVADAGTRSLNVTLTSPGSQTITVTDVDTGAITGQVTLTVNHGAAITSANNATFTEGSAGSVTVTATGTPPPTLTEAGALPTGVTFDAPTGALSGTPIGGTAGIYHLTFTARNGVGSDAVQSFTLTVNPAPAGPAIFSANNTAFTVGVAGSFTVLATGHPAPTLSESGPLPTGVSFTAGTGVLAGTPTAATAGNYPVTFTAHNTVGPDAVQSFTLTVDRAPPPPPPGGGGGPPPPDPVTRLSGPDRIDTAIAISGDSFPAGSAHSVVLARSDSFADALAGTPLAVKKGGPLLLTPPGGPLDPRVAAEIARLLPSGKTVFILGGPAALDLSVDAALSPQWTVVRLSGPDRYATATVVAHDGLGDPGIQLLATGADFPDALAGGAAAANVGGAVLLTDGATVAAPTRAYLAAHVGTRYALGGPAVAAATAAGLTFTAVQGADRFETSVKVAQAFFPAPSGVGVVYGFNFPDALAGGAHIGAKGAPLVLADVAVLPASVQAYLVAEKVPITYGYVYGGTSAVSDTVLGAVQTAIT